MTLKKAMEARFKEISKARGREALEQLIDAVWAANLRVRKIRILHRALWDFANEGAGALPKEQFELSEILRRLSHHQKRLEAFLCEARKNCDDLEQ